MLIPNIKHAETENLLRFYWRSKERLLRLRVKEKILQSRLDDSPPGEDLMKHRRVLVSTQTRIYEILEFMTPFELLFDRLTDEEKKLTEGKYFLNLSNYQIGDMLHCSEKRVRTMQKKIIYKIAEWMGTHNLVLMRKDDPR